MAVQLSSSYLRHSYQILATINPERRMTGAEAFQRATNIVYEWAKSKAHSIFRNLPYNKETLDMKCDGNEIGVLYNEKEEQFVFRLSHIDAYIAGRMWITDVQICRSDDKYLFATRLSVSSLKTCTEDVPFSCPQFVRFIAENIGLIDEYKIQRNAHILNNEMEAERLLQYLESTDRKTAVVLVSPSYFPEEEKYNGYTVDADHMAKELIGVAHVFKISSNIVQYLREKMGKWSVYDGAIRTFYPGLVFEEEEYWRHPRLLREQILMRNTEDRPDGAMLEVIEYVRRFALGRRLPWTESNISFYLAVHQDFLRQQRTTSVQSTQDLIELYEEDLAQSKQACKEMTEMAESYSRDCETEQENNRQLRQRITKLMLQVSNLETRLQRALQAGETLVSIDGSYEEIPTWIEENYPGCLYLSSRAKRSLKKAAYAKLFLIKLQEDGRRYSTVKTVRGVLRPAFQMAVDDDVLVKNPFGFELAGVVVNDTVTREAITKDQMQKFLKFVRDNNVYCKYYEAFYIMFHTGMRISEFCGLTIKDIDPENNIVTIDHQLLRTSKMEYIIQSTKTNAGTRKLPIAEDVAYCFRAIIEDRPTPKVEKFVDGYSGFLHLDKDGMPEVAMHWQHRFIPVRLFLSLGQFGINLFHSPRGQFPAC